MHAVAHHFGAAAGQSVQASSFEIFKHFARRFFREAHDLIDFAAGARTTGHGFYFLKNDAVFLDLALQRYVLDLLVGEGFTRDRVSDRKAMRYTTV